MHVLLLPWRYRLDLHRATMRMVAGDQEKIRSWEWKRKREPVSYTHLRAHET